MVAVAGWLLCWLCELFFVGRWEELIFDIRFPGRPVPVPAGPNVQSSKQQVVTAATPTEQTGQCELNVTHTHSTCTSSLPSTMTMKDTYPA